ncbi:hypothetical protein [Streptomyces sp. PvR034]|uniref:hypothetical protein n=1 Tax=Streptomyces sp. PvR034 TaxID=3156401 RepID=UPI003391F94A
MPVVPRPGGPSVPRTSFTREEIQSFARLSAFEKNYEPVDAPFRLAEQTSVVLLDGGGFEEPPWSVRDQDLMRPARHRPGGFGGNGGFLSGAGLLAGRPGGGDDEGRAGGRRAEIVMPPP